MLKRHFQMLKNIAPKLSSLIQKPLISMVVRGHLLKHLGGNFYSLGLNPHYLLCRRTHILVGRSVRGVITRFWSFNTHGVGNKIVIFMEKFE